LNYRLKNNKQGVWNKNALGGFFQKMNKQGEVAIPDSGVFHKENRVKLGREANLSWWQNVPFYLQADGSPKSECNNFPTIYEQGNISSSKVTSSRKLPQNKLLPVRLGYY